MPILCKPGREGGHGASNTPRLWPVCARQAGGEATWRWGRPGCSRSVLAEAGGRTPGGQHAPGVAGLRTPGRGRSYLAVGTPRLLPVRACQGGREDTRQPARPGRGRDAHAGAREKLRGCGDAPVAAVQCLPGREGGHQAGSTPQPTPVCARRGGGEATWRLGRPGRSCAVLAGAGGRTLGREHASAVAVLRTPGQGRSHLAIWDTPTADVLCLPGREGGH